MSWLGEGRGSYEESHLRTLVKFLHRRIFFRSRTRMPLHQDLMEEDSEEEPDMNWLRESADKVCEANKCRETLHVLALDDRGIYSSTL